jgi:peptidoglycan/LPS O-acetylase OafA/YrhL
MDSERELSQHRIIFLDGLRGVAIVSVITYHLYSSLFAGYMPFGDRYSTFFLARFGWMGVELFFLISGFVILMTMEKCSSLIEFGCRRWLRLFPAMLIASVLIIVYDRFIHSGPAANRSILDLIPGLTFVSPALIHAVTRLQLQSMDDPFWSLYVEVFFYVIFGIVFFMGGWKFAVGIISALFAISVGAEHLSMPTGSLQWRVSSAMVWLGFVYFGWFASGALFFKSIQKSDPRLFRTAIGIAALCALTMHINGGMTIAIAVGLLVVVALFAVTLRSTLLQRILAWRGLVFLGFISYPLYLIHQNITVGLTHLLGGRGREWAALIPLVPLTAVIGVAWLIAAYAEPMMRQLFSEYLFGRRMSNRQKRVLAQARAAAGDTTNSRLNHPAPSEANPES